jgi:hypothetical protein
MRTSPFFFLRLPADSSAALTIVAARTTKGSSRDRNLPIETSVALI